MVRVLLVLVRRAAVDGADDREQHPDREPDGGEAEAAAHPRRQHAPVHPAEARLEARGQSPNGSGRVAWFR